MAEEALRDLLFGELGYSQLVRQTRPALGYYAMRDDEVLTVNFMLSYKVKSLIKQEVA